MQSPPPTHKEPLAVSSFDLPRQVQPNFQIEFFCPRAANSTVEPSWLCAPIFFSAYSVSLRLIFLSFFRTPRQRQNPESFPPTPAFTAKSASCPPPNPAPHR